MKITFESLKDNFLIRYNKCREKEKLMDREIDCYSYVLNSDIEDYKAFLNPYKTGSWLGIFEKKFFEYSQYISDREIFNIKSAYIFFIVNGTDIKEAGRWYKSNVLNVFGDYPKQKYSDEEIERLGTELILEVIAYYEYLNWLKSFKESELQNNVIQEEFKPYIQLIFERFKDFFESETRQSWMDRFFNMGINPRHIIVERSAREGSNRLVLIAILDSVRRNIKTDFDFETFVLRRFGLTAFDKSKSVHKEKDTFNDISKICDNIFKDFIKIKQK
ncbi:MAG: hypothetical protein JXB49_33950 [Bacteroidales bacterium]|nr:hypothetical protein [Bacteroidales bacterium]